MLQLAMMSGSGSEYGNKSEGKNQSENANTAQFPIVAITITGLVEVVEFIVLFFVVYTSWKTFKTTNSSTSICSFMRTLPVLKKCFIVAGIVIFATNTIFFLRLLIPFQFDDNLCSLILRITGSTSYNLAMVSVYMYMWARQYLLHSSPVLKAVLPRWLPILSKMSFLMTVVSFLFPLVIVWLKGDVLAVNVSGICYHKVSAVTLLPGLMMGSTTVTQSLYVVLFYATLKLHQKANRKATGKKTSSNRLAARCLQFTLLAVTSDCVALAAINIFGSLIPEADVILFPKVDLLINLMCMLFCFNGVKDTMKKFVAMMTCNRVTDGHESIASDRSASSRRPSRAVQSTVSQRVEEV